MKFTLTLTALVAHDAPPAPGDPVPLVGWHVDRALEARERCLYAAVGVR